jgi:hypothetical protein
MGCDLHDRTAMSTTSSTPPSQRQTSGGRLRDAAIGMLFAFVLLVPKLLHLRGNAKSWLIFRILLGVAGAALVVLPLGLQNSYLYALVGLVMFIAAILWLPAKPTFSVDDKARELGALVVVNGGRFLFADASSTAVQLFVGAEQITALDANFQPLLVVPVNEIHSVRTEESDGRWLLSMTWARHAAQFTYGGIFAEHLARVAETTLRSVVHPSLPVIPQSRAASV